MNIREYNFGSGIKTAEYGFHFSIDQLRLVKQWSLENPNVSLASWVEAHIRELEKEIFMDDSDD